MKNHLISSLEDTKASIPRCRPPIWAQTGHLQTILGHILPSEILTETGTHLKISLETETELIHSTYLQGTSQFVIYLFHGLGGSSEASYMQRTAVRARNLGHHVFLNNHRGCGLGRGLATEPYHSGRADDLSKIIAYGKAMLPTHRHIAIGFSLSANALLLLAAQVRGLVQPDYAIAVNAPINLERTSLNLQTGLNKIYDIRFTRELENYMKANRPNDTRDFSKIKNVRDFDEYFTAPLGGFKNRSDYYETCSAKQYLTRINIPTVIITAEDDPFISIQDYRETKYSSSTVLHVEKHGGHMGYLTKNNFGHSRWLDIAISTYLAKMSQH